MSVIDSRDLLIDAANQRGAWTIGYHSKIANSTMAATISAGYTTAQMYPGIINLPAITAPSTEVYLTYARTIHNKAAIPHLLGQVVNLGNIALASGTFTAGSSMPTKTIAGVSTVMSAPLIFAVVSTVLVATNPVITITYTDQDGNTGNSAAITVPTNSAIQSAFQFQPHLASGDSGVRAITACTKSAGTSGVIQFYGVIPLSRSVQHTTGGVFNWEPCLGISKAQIPLLGGDRLGFFSFGTATVGDIYSALSFTPD